MNLNAGLLIPPGPGPDVVDRIVIAERRGLSAVWSTSGTVSSDTLTTFAIAASRTEHITIGTSILPTYPRHPFVTASEAIAIEDFAPGRLRLGIGPSHRPIIEGEFGIPLVRPLEHLREYLTILRALLWDGTVDFNGAFFDVKTSIPDGFIPPKTPLPISTLRPNAWRLAGEISDGALSWLAPVAYIVRVAIPALDEGAKIGRRSRPPVIFHVPVAVTTDRTAARAAFREQFGYFGYLPFFTSMFALAGHTIEADGYLPDSLVDEILISGTADRIRERLESIHNRGIDELLVSHVIIGDESRELEILSTVLAD